ncbi:MAG: hypothetical protein H6Q13_855, partial [Bacteroidetes bacterium]|nr:hypothetical protein [Bacteroidota bacterium]
RYCKDVLRYKRLNSLRSNKIACLTLRASSPFNATQKRPVFAALVGRGRFRFASLALGYFFCVCCALFVCNFSIRVSYFEDLAVAEERRLVE